ncbi:MAG: two-component sensor histidine kinase [Alphaproteobacteria bacterium]|nr:two-component sensor histidine kinase [Alphaproteobacteria bacterium]
MRGDQPGLSFETLLDAIPHPLFLIGPSGTFAFANDAAQFFFQMSGRMLARQPYDEILPFASPLTALIDQVRELRASMSEYGITLDGPRFGRRIVDAQVVPLEGGSSVLVLLQERSIAQRMTEQLTQRGAVRSIVGMASLLAHEIKNPLAGIKGAAQLLEQSVMPDDRALTSLICEETDRVAKLVDRMEGFGEGGPFNPAPVNIHQVLERVRLSAQAGFASNLTFIEEYDPSLPPVWGERDRLIQVILNLVKNAAEALENRAGGQIILSTTYRPGVRLSAPGSPARVNLPLEVAVRDNGPGVPEDIRPHLFDPFISSKRQGAGLGLALVAKIVGDHGGVIECDSEPGSTVFRLRLPMVPSEAAPTAG